MRSVTELLDPEDRGAEEVRRILAHAVNPVEVVRGDRARGERALARVQAPTSTPLGAVAYRLGGLWFDHGWLRLLGSGSPRLARDLAGWNGPFSAPRIAGATLVADDAIGGFFAVDGGAFGARDGVHYFAPDSGAWEEMDIDYHGLLEWAANGDLDSFYEDLRWPGWEVEALGLGADQVFAFDPPLVEEAAQRTRSRAPIEAAWARAAAALTRT
jgi:hypothetical protein